jgi:hypothetical protein
MQECPAYAGCVFSAFFSFVGTFVEGLRNPTISLFRTFEEFVMNPRRFDKVPDPARGRDSRQRKGEF